MKLEKLPSGSYRVRKMYKGVQYTVVFDSKPTQKEAMQALAAEMDKIQTDKQRMSFRTAAEQYIEMEANVISPCTVKEYLGIIGRLSKKFTNCLLSDITPLTVQTEVNRLSKDHAPKTVYNYHGFISTVLGAFKPDLVLNTTLPQKQKKIPYIPTDEDVERVLNYAKGSMFEIAIILACFGMRRSEICALTIDDIEDNIIHINKALVMNKDKKWVLKTTKTESSTRDIWVPDEVIQLIQDRKCIYKGSPNSITCYLTKVQNKLGIPHFSLHKLRHYYASMSHALGIPDSYIMESGGWGSDYVLRNVYRHTMNDKREEMNQFAGEYLKEIMFK